MKVCGIELKNNEAIICLLSLSNGLFDLPDFRTRRLTLKANNDAETIRDFQFSFAKLMEDYKVDKVLVRERMMKGKFAGGAIGFKLEAAIQLISNLQVELLSPKYIKEAMRQNPLPIHFSDTGLKAFQEAAFLTAYAGLVPVKEIDNSASGDRD